MTYTVAHYNGTHKLYCKCLYLHDSGEISSTCIRAGRDVITFNAGPDTMAEIEFLAIASQVNEE